MPTKSTSRCVYGKAIVWVPRQGTSNKFYGKRLYRFELSITLQLSFRVSSSVSVFLREKQLTSPIEMEKVKFRPSQLRKRNKSGKAAGSAGARLSWLLAQLG